MRWYFPASAMVRVGATRAPIALFQLSQRIGGFGIVEPPEAKRLSPKAEPSKD
jgi:hypothetical protein